MRKKKHVRVDPKRPKRKRKRGKGKSIKRKHNGRTREQSQSHTSGTDGCDAFNDDALSKLLIEKAVITEEFKKKLGEERATYQTILKSIEQ